MLLQRVAPRLKNEGHLVGAHDVDYAYGRALAMLQITPEDNLQALQEVQRGETVPIEEIRRELRGRAG